MRRELIAVVGPTCTGKTPLALALGEALGGPAAAALMSCDSVKIYRDADVGSGKLPASARRGFDLFMVDVAAPGEVFNAARYMAAARAACERIWQEDRVTVVVGGTGLYFRALVDGICAAPGANVALRAQLHARLTAGEDLYRYLREADAAAAARINPADVKRVVRALEVYEATGFPLSSFQRTAAAPLAVDRFAVYILDGPRPWLAARVAARTERLLAAGLRNEVARLLDAGLGPSAPPLNAIGYKEMVAVLRDGYDERAARDNIITSTMRLAKRQRTWFRRERRALWLDATRGPAALSEEIIAARATSGF